MTKKYILALLKEFLIQLIIWILLDFITNLFFDKSHFNYSIFYLMFFASFISRAVILRNKINKKK